MPYQDTVLLTRLPTQNQQLIQTLKAVPNLSLTFVERPLLEFAGLPASAATRQRVLALDTYDHVIFVSQNAVTYGFDVLEAYWPQWPMALNWYGVGATTGTLLNDVGIKCQVPDDYSSEGLLGLADLQVLTGRKVLIVRGQEGGREYLREALLQRGAEVDYLPVYTRRFCTYPQGFRGTLQPSRLLAGVVFSGEGLRCLVSLMDWPKPDLRLIVPSHRLQKLAMQLGFDKVNVCTPVDAAVAAEIERIWLAENF
ncbi:MAG: uroporphyrinogen-III synthase [Urechidicola sp.]|jgi:uroporphyrinogen-III synthase